MEQFVHHRRQLPSDGEFSTKCTRRQAVYDVWVHNTMFEEDNTPQVLQTLWLETCCTRETPSDPLSFQEHRHSPEKDVKPSID